MRRRTLRHRLALVAAGALLASAALGHSAPPASATPMSYLQALNDNGITVTDTTKALTMGYAVCANLNRFNGADVARSLYLNTDVATPAMATAIVVIAVEQLCPQHDHRGLVAA